MNDLSKLFDYTVEYCEYGQEKTMKCFAEDANGLKKKLNFWQGAYGFERCTAPIIRNITSPKGKKILAKYIELFNEASRLITGDALPEMDHQSMDWAKPISIAELLVDREVKDDEH